MKKMCGKFFLLLLILSVVKKGSLFEVTFHFLEGNVTFTWPQISPYQDVSITCDGHHRGFSRVYDNRIVVSNVLDYNVIDILVRGVAGHGYRYIEKRKKFHQNVMIVAEGRDIKMMVYNPQTLTQFEKVVFRLNSAGSSTVHHLTSEENLSESYMLELTKVTPSDSGYYAIGVNEEEARSNNGVVLVIKASPDIPIISGNKRVPRGQTTTLTCNSVSRSRPHYYTKFPSIVYTWFVNESERKYNTQRLELPVYVPTVVKCQAKEGLLFTSQSISIEPLYGPERVEIVPSFNQTVTLHDGDSFDPVTCTADCNPACHFQWKEITLDGKVNDLSNSSTLPLHTVHAKVSRYRCVATGFHGNSHDPISVTREIYLNIQYLALPTISTVYNGQETNSIIIHAKEGTSLLMKCAGTGNPEPDVFITPVDDSSLNSLQLTSTSERQFEKLQCDDTQQYYCTARSPGFNDAATHIKVFVECPPRLDERVMYHRQYRSNLDDNVTVQVPVIAYPKPKNVLLVGGPRSAPLHTIEGTITQREGSPVYTFLVTCDIPVLNQSIFRNFTLYINEVEIVTISILQNEAERTSSALDVSWSKLKYVVIPLGGAFGIFSFLCALFYMRRRRYKGRKALNARVDDATRTIGSEAETFFNEGRIYYCTTSASNDRDCEYERLPNLSDDFRSSHIRHIRGHKFCVSSFPEIEPEAETYMHDGRIYYSIRETLNAEQNRDYEEFLVSTENID